MGKIKGEGAPTADQEAARWEARLEAIVSQPEKRDVIEGKLLSRGMMIRGGDLSEKDKSKAIKEVERRMDETLGLEPL